MSGLLQISTIDHHSGRVFRLRGSLDAASTPPLDQLVNELLKPDALIVPIVVFDLSEIDMMGSLAMGAFIRLHRGLTLRHSSLRLATLPPSVLGAMKHARLDRFFEIYDSVEGALGEIIG